MKKELFTSIICFSSLLFSSCGRTKVNVKLIGDEYIGWEKESDIASVNKNYVIKAVPKIKGYWLYPEYLEVLVNGHSIIEGKEMGYTFTTETQTLVIHEKAITGDIEIKGQGRVRDNKVIFKFPADTYVNLPEEEQPGEFLTDFYVGGINLTPELLEKKKSMPTIDQIKVSPSINFTYEPEESGENKPYYIKIAGADFYTDVTFTFPEIK